MNRNIWKKLIRIAVQRHGACQNMNTVRKLTGVHFEINVRHGYRQQFDAVAENNMVALVRDGMDCDCTQYHSVRHIPKPVSVVAWLKAEYEHREWLDGPESLYIGQPSAFPERYVSADRALEAYENGHPHNVQWGDL